jgi:hypothetical protein
MLEVQARLSALVHLRTVNGLSNREQDEYDALIEREAELLHPPGGSTTR